MGRPPDAKRRPPVGTAASTVHPAQEVGHEEVYPTPPVHPVLGLDGKRYPGRPASRESNVELVFLVHVMRHDERISVRLIQQRLLEDHGVRRSVGWAHWALSSWTCPACPGVQVEQNGAPEQQDHQDHQGPEQQDHQEPEQLQAVVR